MSKNKQKHEMALILQRMIVQDVQHLIMIGGLVVLLFIFELLMMQNNEKKMENLQSIDFVACFSENLIIVVSLIIPHVYLFNIYNKFKFKQSIIQTNVLNI